MVSRKNKHGEHLPWYRAKDYKGNLTEDEKRELDAFRLRETKYGEIHPAAHYVDLPDEVQSYISKLQIEPYDEIQGSLAGRCLFWSVVGAFLLLNYFGWVPFEYHSTEALVLGAALLLAPWIYYSRKWKRNADQYVGAGLTDEAIRTEWELDYLVDKHAKESRSKSG